MFSNSTQKSLSGQGDDLSGTLIVHKKRGETLAALLLRIRNEYSIGLLQNGQPIPITYAGRLDPMAEGEVLLLVGSTCKEKEQYLGLDKTYRFEVLLGVSTDTADVLGKITASMATIPEITDSAIKETVTRCLEKSEWSYPVFSSKTIDGVPLFVHARQGTLPEVLPVQTGTLKTLQYVGKKVVSFAELRNTIIADIGLVQGDFRQSEIVALWQQCEGDTAILLEFEAQVTSGFYIRTLATYIAECLGCVGLAYRIVRVKVGE